MKFQEIYMDEDLSHRLKIIQWCCHCGEEVKKGNKYCDSCSTAEGRRQLDEQNETIKAENLLLGFNYSN